MLTSFVNEEGLVLYDLLYEMSSDFSADDCWGLVCKENAPLEFLAVTDVMSVVSRCVAVQPGRLTRKAAAFIETLAYLFFFLADHASQNAVIIVKGISNWTLGIFNGILCDT
jgi:hypothetical protein